MRSLLLCCSAALLLFPSIAEACPRCGNLRQCQFVKQVQKVVVQDHYVQPYVQPIVKQNISYFVGAPVRETALLGYEAIDVAAQGQLAREMQRLTERFAELQTQQQQRYAQPQMVPYGYMPQYAPPQYAQPQVVQPQCAVCPAGEPGGNPPQPAPTPPPDGAPPQQPNNPNNTFSLQTPPGHPPALGQCAQCHSGLNPKGAFDITPGRALPWDQRVNAMQRAAAGEMPPPGENGQPGRPPLDDSQLGALARELFTSDEWNRLNQ